MNDSSKLKERRKELGLTQGAVAKKADISLRVYKIYESGERIPRADTAILIARTLKSAVEKLFG